MRHSMQTPSEKNPLKHVHLLQVSSNFAAVVITNAENTTRHTEDTFQTMSVLLSSYSTLFQKLFSYFSRILAFTPSCSLTVEAVQVYLKFRNRLVREECIRII